jgi:hypothetical protein
MMDTKLLSTLNRWRYLISRHWRQDFHSDNISVVGIADVRYRLLGTETKHVVTEFIWVNVSINKIFILLNTYFVNTLV